MPDDQFQRGLIFGTEAVSAAGFARQLGGASSSSPCRCSKGLELSLAGRYDDYSDFGDTTNPKVALRWAPIEDAGVPRILGHGFRAPSLAQIGLGPSQESQFFIDTFGCADNPGSLLRIRWTTTSIFSGNPNLQPEESET